MKRLDKKDIRKILVISLSNTGDIVLTFPVLDLLKEEFPKAKISVVVGPKGEAFFKNNPFFDQIYIFNKRQHLFQTIEWVCRLWKEKFEMVVDLRNTAIPFFLGCRYRTTFWTKNEDVHMRNKHLNRLRKVYPFKREVQQSYALFIPDEDRQYVDGLLRREALEIQQFVVVAPGAANNDKRWSEEGFQEVCDYISRNYNKRIILVGDQNDREVVGKIQNLMKSPSVNFCGRLTLLHLAELLKRSSFVLSNDSAPMHLASYLDVPVLAFFGPSDPRKYGPWSQRCWFIQRNDDCQKCSNNKITLKHSCMSAITSKTTIELLNSLAQEGVISKR